MRLQIQTQHNHQQDAYTRFMYGIKSDETSNKKIKFTKEEREEINLINAGKTVPKVRTIINKKTGVKQDIVTNRRFTYETGWKRLLELHGGLCRCGSWPLFKVMFQVGDEKQRAWLVERYCQKCYDNQEKYMKK